MANSAEANLSGSTCTLFAKVGYIQVQQDDAENAQAFNPSRKEKFTHGFFRQMHEICANFA